MFEVIEHFGSLRDDHTENLLFHGENLHVMEFLRDQGWNEKFKLIYCDPPFFSGTTYRYQHNSEHAQVDAFTYDDKWRGGLSEYLEYLRERFVLMRDLLAPNGSLWVHVGLKASHHVKLLLDEVFGEQHWINQIIWKKTNSPKAQSRSFGNQYDVILVHARNKNEFTLNPTYKSPSPEYLKNFSKDDGDGKGPYQTVALMAGGLQKPAGRKVFEFKGVTAAWLYSKETLEQFWEEGRIYKTNSGKYRLKVYLKDITGQPVSDLWTDKDVAPLQGVSSEYLGFQTQKPESLLERIIRAATDEGDLVGDFFVGSGTTASVAQKLTRKWIVADVSSVAIHLTRKRLLLTLMADRSNTVLPLANTNSNKSSQRSRFSVLEPQVTLRDIHKSFKLLQTLTHDSKEKECRDIYYWQEKGTHRFLATSSNQWMGTDVASVVREMVEEGSFSGATVHCFSHQWDLSMVSTLQEAIQQSHGSLQCWGVHSSTVKDALLLQQMLQAKKKKRKTRKKASPFLNNPMWPWLLPKIDFSIGIKENDLMLSFTTFEIMNLNERAFSSMKNRVSIHLDYCAVQVGKKDLQQPLHPSVVIFSIKKRKVDWTHLKINLEEDVTTREVPVRVQLIDLLGRSLFSTFVIHPNDKPTRIHITPNFSQLREPPRT